MHCYSKFSCYLSVQFDLLTENQPLSLSGSEVPFCSIILWYNNTQQKSLH